MTAPLRVRAAGRATSAAAYRVRATRRMLVIALLATAVVRALALALIALALLALADLAADVPLAVRRMSLPAAGVAGLIASSLTLWRGRKLRSLERVALWVEERIPWLNYSLVTAIDPRFARAHPALEPVVGEAQWGGLVILAWWRAVRVPLAVAAGSALVLLLLPGGATARTVTPRAGDSVGRLANGSGRDPLSPLAATIRPPAYTGLREESLDDPHTISAIAGSEIAVRGRGPADAVRALVGGRPFEPLASDGGWTLRLTMPRDPAALRLTARGEDRWVALEPRADEVPIVRLTRPARDSVLRQAAGSVVLAGAAADDHGLAAVAFEVIVSSGQGENFSFRTLTLGARNAAGATRADLEATLHLDSLRLVAGDVLHVRATARDRNTVTGPGVGASETRAFRIARPGEYDSVAVEGAPPPEVDRSLLSQRMLILQAERLHARRALLEHPVMVSESRGIAADQTRLRQRVGELIFIRLEGEDTGEHAHGPGDGHNHGPEGLGAMTPEQIMAAAEAATSHDGSEPLDFAHGESPVVNVNRPLLEAYNAMWLAGSELEQGSPGRALPHMRVALEALQRAREAERVYLRGRPPALIVDIADARMKGGERGRPAAREPPEAAVDAWMQRARRLDRALAMFALAPDAAVDSLLLLRLDALATAPSLAAALGDAIEALRTGRDATAALARARRAGVGEPDALPSLPAWGAGW